LWVRIGAPDRKGCLLTHFSDLGLNKVLLSSIVAQGYDTPTPIQTKAIPLVLEGRDLIGLAQTGTGKTAAFGLPLVQHLLDDPKGRPLPKSVKSLILAPTRELANQIAASLNGYVRDTPLKVTVVVGGASINTQIRKLGRGVDILVATPGRLLDLVERRAVILETATFLVLDEADHMLDMGFIQPLRRIAKLLGRPRQTLLFSATMPAAMEELAQAYLKDPVRVEVSPPGKAADKITQELHYVPQAEKPAMLIEMLSARKDDLSLVFARTKHGAEKLMKQLVASGLQAASIHGNKSQGQRDRALAAFKAGDIRVLVATDVAARGIDIAGVSHVYNYDLPDAIDNYVHRIGRTARAGRDGKAIAFCAAEEVGQLRAIQKLMGIEIPVISGTRPEERKRPGPNGRRSGQGQKSSGKPRQSHGHAPAGGKPAQRRQRKPRGRSAA